MGSGLLHLNNLEAKQRDPTTKATLSEAVQRVASRQNIRSTLPSARAQEHVGSVERQNLDGHVFSTQRVNALSTLLNTTPRLLASLNKSRNWELELLQTRSSLNTKVHEVAGRSLTRRGAKIVRQSSDEVLDEVPHIASWCSHQYLRMVRNLATSHRINAENLTLHYGLLNKSCNRSPSRHRTSPQPSYFSVYSTKGQASTQMGGNGARKMAEVEHGL